MQLNNGLIMGLAMLIFGVVLVVLGLRQRHRVAFERVPLTSWHFKLFFGGALAIIALNILFHSVVGR